MIYMFWHARIIMDTLMDIYNSVSIITGAASGFGLKFTKYLLENKGMVYMLD